MVPSAFDTWLKATMRVRGPSSFSYSSRMTSPRSFTGATRSRAPFSAAKLLPGNDVGVVLEPGDDDLVVLLNVATAPALGHQVDAFGCAAHKDNLAGGGRVQEAAHFFARAFVGIGGARRQRVGGAVDVRVLVLDRK